MEKRLDRFAIASSTVVTYLITVGSVSAQIVPDHTLPVNSRVTPGCTTCTIEGGTVRGSNLFHSFREFSVPVGGEAFFNNPPEIENIFSRVTGSNLSYINGWIRANGTANLFLLNPNGIIFGPNAQLDIQGSFLASTANSFTFADGSEFGATNPQGPPLLTISVPFGLQYGNNPGNIEVRGSHLQVNPGKTLALVGGDLSIDGGQLQADGGQIQLGGVTGEGTVGSVANSYEPSLNFPLADDLPLSDVSLHNGTKINVSANGDGKIAIDARNLTMAGESRLQAGSSGLESSNSNPGDIEINATEAINLTESSSIENLVFSEAMGKGGDINIRTRSLSLSGGANVVAHTFGRGNAGNVTINASGAISLDGASTGIGSQVFENAVGNGGNITITTGTLSLSDGATLPRQYLRAGKCRQCHH
ncbi:filamentous hemagglutinin N-terminal domain-containing protein [Capilliphycus salinus ALCB114379]|uniref:two-partner secretion domain-containing protein n=1 Tax=Capilliphycus salinus TaxID=2768948 RepID=UPI0039A6FEAB